MDLSLHTLTYGAAPELLKGCFSGAASSPDYGLFPEHLGLIGFDLEGWTWPTSSAGFAIIPGEEGKCAASDGAFRAKDGKRRIQRLCLRIIL